MQKHNWMYLENLTAEKKKLLYKNIKGIFDPILFNSSEYKIILELPINQHV